MVEDFINYARTKYVDLDSLRTDCTLKTPFSLSDLRIDISSLWSSLHSGDFSAFPIAGVQDFLTFQHYGSVSPPSQKLSVVISALHRICMSSMNLDDFWISTSDLVSELGTLEYPSSVISTAISRVSSHPRFASLSLPS